MLTLNIKNEYIGFKDIRPEQLPQILDWYNNTQEFKYATGVDKPITMKCLIERYSEVAICSREFFVGVYDNQCGQMVGILKGRLKNDHSPVVWINSIAIDPAMRGRGYGSQAIELLLEYLKETIRIKNAYISVVEDNATGIQFWNNRGFEKIRKIENHLAMDDKKYDVIIMGKTL